MTLAELRTADDAWRAYAASTKPDIIVPLGLSGDYQVETTVMDSSVDYFLADFQISLLPEMTAWDVMRSVAKQFADSAVMNKFEFASLTLPCDGWLGVILYAFTDLSDEQLDAMPFADVPESGTDR